MILKLHSVRPQYTKLVYFLADSGKYLTVTFPYLYLSMSLENQKPKDNLDELNSAEDVGQRLYSEESDREQPVSDSTESSNSQDSQSDLSTEESIFPDSIAESLTEQSIQEITEESASIENASQNPAQLNSKLDRAMDSLNVTVSDGEPRTLAMENSAHGQVRTTLNESGVGNVEIGGQSMPVDLSSVDKIFESTRESSEQLSARTQIAAIPGDGTSFDSMTLMANSTQRVELNNGDVLHRLPKNAAGVKWVKDVGGKEGDHSVIAYEDGRREIRYTKPREDGITSVGFNQNSKVASVEFDRESPESQPDSDEQVESKPVLSETFQTGNLELQQNYDSETGKVVTQFPDGFGRDLESGQFDSDLAPELENVKSISYDPNNQENPYSVEMAEGKDNPEQKARLLAKLKSGEVSIPLSFHPEGENPESINFFSGKFNSSDPADRMSGQIDLKPDGTLEYKHAPNENGVVSTVKFPPNDPQRRIEATRYDASVTSQLDRENPLHGVTESVKYLDEEGNLQERHVRAGDSTQSQTDESESTQDNSENTQDNLEDREKPQRLEGATKSFEHGNEKGSLYTDEKTGYLSGIKFEEGNRAGQEYLFGHDARGNLETLTVRIPQEEGEPQEVRLTKEGDNWRIEPKDAKIPGFESMEANGDGLITGNLKVKESGDIVYDAGDGNMEVMRINGTHDKFNLNDYHRQRTTADGQSKSEYWDGYEWRQGELERNEDGTSTITFSGEGKVRKIMRDSRTQEDGSKNDGVVVLRSDGTVYNANWKGNSMSRTRGEQTDNLYDSGLTDANGKTVWVKGTKTGNTVQFDKTDPRVREQIEQGKLPETAEHHENGDITSVFRDKHRVRTDKEGRVNGLEYANGQSISLDRDSYGRVYGVEGIDGKKLVRQEHLAAGEDGTGMTRWSVEGGEQGETFDGRLTIGQDNSVELTGVDGRSTAIDSTGRTVKKDGENITSVIDPYGQRWLREVREGEQSTGEEPWTVISRNGDSHTFNEGGEITLLNDGAVGVKYSDGKVESIRENGQFSTYNKEGQEVSVVYQDGSHILRDDQGYLKEIKRRVDGNSVDADPSDRQYELREFVHEDGKFIGVKVNGEPAEVFVDGQLRELKGKKDFSDTSSENLGRYVSYKPDSALRTVRESAEENAPVVEVEDIEGNRREFNSEGNLVAGRIFDRQRNTVFEIADGRVASVENTSSGLKRTYKYSGENSQPQEVYQSKEGGEPVLIARLSDAESGANARTPYEVFPHGESPNPDADRSERVFGQLNPKTGTLEYYNKDPLTGDNTGIWADNLDGSRVLGVGSKPYMQVVDGKVNRFFEPSGAERQFVYQDGNLSEVVRAGQPPVVTDRMVDGKLMAVDPTNPEKYLGPSSYDTKTGAYRIDFQDGEGNTTGSLERFTDGRRIEYDSSGKRVSASQPGVWKETYEDNVRMKREYANGSYIEFDRSGNRTLERSVGQYTDRFEDGQRVKREFDNGAQVDFEPDSGRVARTVDAYGIERTFTYRDKFEGDLPDSENGNSSPNDIVEVRARNTNEEGSTPEVVEKIGSDGDLHPVAEGKEHEVVSYAYRDSQSAPIAGTRTVSHSFSEAETPVVERATRYMMNGDKLQYKRGEDWKMVEFGPEDEHEATGGAHTESIEAIESVSAMRTIQDREYADVGEIPEETKGTSQSIDELTLEHQKQALIAHAEKLPNKESTRLLNDLEHFEIRANESGLSSDEVARTLYYANALLESQNPVSPLSKSDTVRAALALMHGAGDPEISNHGLHNTCGTTTSRESMLSTNPSLAGQIAYLSMTEGQITFSANGEIRQPGENQNAGDTRIVLDAASLKADNESILSAASSIKSDATGYRDQLGQVLDHTLVNYAHLKQWNKANPTRQIEEAVYTQTTATQEGDTGERLNLPGLEELSQANLSFEMLAELNRTLLGEERLAINSTVERDSQISAQFANANQLMQVVTDGLESGPMTLLVNASHPAFTDSPQDSDQWDLVNISDSRELEGKQYFKISGFHGKKSDKWISSSDLYNATLNTNDHNARELDSFDVDRLSAYNRNNSGTLDDIDLSTFESAEEMFAVLDQNNFLNENFEPFSLDELDSRFRANQGRPFSSLDSNSLALV